MMQCSACKHGSLVPARLDDLFNAHRCNHCGGHWLLISDFALWKEANPNQAFAPITRIEESEDSPMALFCPVSHTLMRKLTISTDTEHSLDYSAVVGGIWLDKAKWPQLKSLALLSCLNLLVTEGWQLTLTQHQTEQHVAEHYRSQFGDETFNEINRIRAWLAAQPNRAELEQYLLADEPYHGNRDPYHGHR